MSEVKKLHLAYSTDEEHLSNDGLYNTYEEALEDAINDCDPEVGDTIYISQITKWNPKPSADDIIERMNEEAYEICGDGADDWPNCSKEERGVLQTKLEQLVDEWLIQIKEKDRLYKCFSSKEFLVTKEMLGQQPAEEGK